MNKVAMITGARRGLGLAVAKKFAGGGYNIVLNDREEYEKLLEIQKELEEKYSVSCFVCFGDVANEDDVIKMLENVKSAFGRLDVLVNNAGIVYDMELDERPTSIFEETMHNNVTGTYLMSKYFGHFMFESEKTTRIINVASTNGMDCNFPTSIDYDASKAAIISLTKNFALEYAPRILVNAVAPGWIKTEMNSDLPKDLVLEEASKIYLKRFAEPSEIASLIYYLGSDENTFVNNEIIKIDGGY